MESSPANSNGQTNRAYNIDVSEEISIEGLSHETPGCSNEETDRDSDVQRTPCCKSSSQRNGQKEQTSFLNLFRFADKLDVFLMLSGSLLLIGLGILTPVNAIIIGQIISELIYYETPPSIGNVTTIQFFCATNNGGTKALDESLALLTGWYIPLLVGVAAAGFSLAYSGMVVWTWAGDRQIRRAQCVYFEAVMRQSIGWFDVHNAGELNSRLIEDIDQYRAGFGDNIASLIQWLSVFISGYVVGLSISWKLTLVMLAFLPLSLLCFGFFGKVMGTMTQKQLTASAKAAAVAEEVFSSIRTVAAFGGEEKEANRYSLSLNEAFQLSVRKDTGFGVVIGIAWFVICTMSGVAIRYGVTLLQEECLAPGAIVTVFVSVFLANRALAQAAPMFVKVSIAQAATTSLFKLIDGHVEIKISSDEGYKPETLEGTIEFDGVDFFYPTRPEVKVLNNLSYSVKKGETVALVGESGCGKSTTIQLIQRFYDCTNGKVLIDGKDLREYNLACLRNFMGIVSQEPVLFATTIGENIRLGAKWGEEVTQEQIETAAKQSNCYGFISNLPKGFDTLVGERGVQLSGGQKQRIAIARALVRNPAILLLDEATSALDTQSEAIVQDALEKASEGRTTIVIAHRLSTVKGANKIFAFKDGQVHEQGTHDELMSMEGIYYSLVMRQLQGEKEDVMEDDENLNGDDSPIIPAAVDIKDVLIPVTGFDDQNLPKQRDRVSLENIENSSSAPEISHMEIWRLSRPEWPLIALAVLCSMGFGCIHPASAVLTGFMIEQFAEANVEEQLQQSTVLVGFLIGLGLLACITATSQNFFVSLANERLTKRLREQVFSLFTHHEIGFFDEEKHSVGLLISKLSTEASLVKGALAARYGLLGQGFTTTVGVILIVFFTLWEAGLLTLVIIPIVLISGKSRVRAIKGDARQDKDKIEEGGKIAHVAVSENRTVTSLNMQKYFTEKYNLHFKKLYKDDIKNSLSSSVAYSLSESLYFILSCLFYGFSGYLIVCRCIPWRSETELITVAGLVRMGTAVVYGSASWGRVAADMPDLAKAKLAAANIKSMIQEKLAIDSASAEGEKLDSVDGDIEFRDVEFTYPTRKEVQVLQGLNFNVKKGETLALVGSSGCGKSTTVSLLERFYDATAGRVAIDGRDVKELNVQWLRRHLGIVSQEPTLFDATIAENIAYGDNTRDVSMTEIIDAATQANVHNFISDLPKGYETNVGAKGTQLSGGQKQRIAIARILVRNPAMLLLDEATSALDVESEKIVQEALDKALKGRTAIIIAHRLSTIRNADKIGVIDNGKIVEMGTHQQLLDKKEYYFNLINAQL